MNPTSYQAALPCYVRAGIEKDHASTWPHAALCSIASPKGSTPVSLGRIRLSVTAVYIGPALQLLLVLWAWKMCVSTEKWAWEANRYVCVTMGTKSEEKPARMGGVGPPEALRQSAKTKRQNWISGPASSRIVGVMGGCTGGSMWNRAAVQADGVNVITSERKAGRNCDRQSESYGRRFGAIAGVLAAL